MRQRALYIVIRQVLGPATIQRTRGSIISFSSETKASSCSNAGNGEDTTASYTWGLVSAVGTIGGYSSLTLLPGRDPRVLTIPAYTLGLAGSTYTFQLKAALGGTHNVVNATGGCQ